MRVTWRWAPLLVTLKNMLNKVLEMDICFHRSPACGEHGGMLSYVKLVQHISY